MNLYEKIRFIGPSVSSIDVMPDGNKKDPMDNLKKSEYTEKMYNPNWIKQDNCFEKGRRCLLQNFPYIVERIAWEVPIVG